MLVTKHKIIYTKPDVAARTKDLRLKGSDLYVARLGTCNTSPRKSSTYVSPQQESPPPLPTPSAPSSLYDELSPLSRTPSPKSVPKEPVNKLPEIRPSRPCYRCVTAMHSVGIKRVFWTNHDGQWEGAKVRDLVVALESGGAEDDGDGIGTGQASKGVFVTKHEVLMLKRMMGSGG